MPTLPGSRGSSVRGPPVSVSWMRISRTRAGYRRATPLPVREHGLVELRDAVDVGLHREPRSSGRDAPAQPGHVGPPEPLAELVRALEAQPDALALDEPAQRPMAEGQHGQAAAEIVEQLVGQRRVEVGAVQGRVEARPAEV